MSWDAETPGGCAYCGALPCDQVLHPSDAWETFSDPSYFDMWCVRRSDERVFGQGFHLVNGDEAKELCALLNRLSTRNGGS